MESQTIVEYELIEPVSNTEKITFDRYEALEHYDAEWLVYERHITRGNPSRFVQAEQIVTISWNNNPEFEEEQNDSHFE
jgi:hypothetical protein